MRRETKELGIVVSGHVSETEAYDLIREKAMSSRSTTEEVAKAIFEAHEMLSMGGKR